jgi:hypothetical protein
MRNRKVAEVGARLPRFDDSLLLPGTGESPADRIAKLGPLIGTPGQSYVERRNVPAEVANAAGVRFDADFRGRPAVVAALRDERDGLVSLHGRYLEHARCQGKMFTFGRGDGVIWVLGGWKAEPLILVEGLFDALSLATCGWASVATIGRWAPWLAEVSAGRVVWLAFDRGRPGEAEVARYAHLLPAADLHRLPPPTRCKDWNTALAKRGRSGVTKWVSDHLAKSNGAQQLRHWEAAR